MIKPLLLAIAVLLPDPTTLLHYTHPADKWENALPVGNGRLGAMVFGKIDEEQIQINEETYWSGGPYSTTVKGGFKALPEIRQAIFRWTTNSRPPPVWTSSHGLSGRTAEIPVLGQPGTEVRREWRGQGLSPRARSRHGDRDNELRTRRRPLQARGLRRARAPGHHRAPDGRRAGQSVVHGAASRRAKPGAFELCDRLLPDGRPWQRRPHRPRQVG